MHSNIKQIAFKVGMLGQSLLDPLNCAIIHDRLGPGLRNDVKALTLRISTFGLQFDDAQYEEANRCLKCPCSANFLAFHGTLKFPE